ncbi:hypothetical protein [Micromonospora cathayae]|uniref:Secreted protein n=1 Tax=Micromonospora cathayae TaxID=3028804 RepID=A0ABY7ZM01_9ACTN|nr:hypothetical protein [Micromonospora sp. HUAS 3]WDZ84006.1 hypothetical protein PVK37_26620 [Micromonospora sp. HUAS 3]
MKRTLIALIATSGLILGLPASASAHDTNDWAHISSIPSGYGYVGYAESQVGGVYQRVTMWRDNYNVLVLQAYASDTEEDGYCGSVQITYETPTSGGGWSGHYHTRGFGITDCTTNGAGVYYRYALSTTRFRNVYARACHSDPAANIIHCESNWHGPI